MFVKVAVYYPWIYLTSGAERTLLELTGRSRHDWTIFTSRFEPENTFPEFVHRRVVELSRISVKRTLVTTLRSAFRLMRQRLPLEGQDALVVVCEGLGDLVVFRNGSLPLLNLCLTPLRIAFDPAYRTRYQRDRALWQRSLLAAGAAAFRTVDRLAWKRYDSVFCISEESSRRARAGGLRARKPPEVLHPGLGFEPGEPSLDSEPVFLLPGRIVWTKNVELGLQAFQRFVRSEAGRSDFRLVIAGIVDEKSKPYLEKLREMAADEPRVEFRISPTDSELARLYSSCYAVLFTSFNEDWGIVPIEAMAFGKPVIAVNRGGPLESLRQGVQGYLEEPLPEAFAQRMVELVRNPELAREMGRAGHLRAQAFSWSGFTEKIDREIEHLVSKKRMAAQDDSLPSRGEPGRRDSVGIGPHGMGAKGTTSPRDGRLAASPHRE